MGIGPSATEAKNGKDVLRKQNYKGGAASTCDLFDFSFCSALPAAVSSVPWSYWKVYTIRYSFGGRGKIVVAHFVAFGWLLLSNISYR